jgi:hypothetical protein
MEEANVVLSWRAEADGGFTVWAREKPAISVRIATWGDADFYDELVHRAIYELDVMTPCFLFEVEPPFPPEVAPWTEPAWYVLGEGAVVEVPIEAADPGDQAARADDPGEARIQAMHRLHGTLFDGGVCAACHSPVGARNRVPLPAFRDAGTYHGFWRDLGRQRIMVYSRTVLDLLGPGMDGWFRRRPARAVRPWWGRWFSPAYDELVPTRAVELCSLRANPPFSQACASCGAARHSYVGPESPLNYFMRRERLVELAGTRVACVRWGAQHHVLVDAGVRAALLREKRAYGFAFDRVGFLGADQAAEP